jgi:hypothetical protein
LAKAFSALQRGRALDREGTLGGSEEDSTSPVDHNTPEHSPPPSPMKPTPRHSALESETLKTSLGHAQRTIQTLRTNIHREKTEKLEMKRMLQDARDEIEKLRGDPNPAPKRNRKAELREAKKPNFKLNQLGVPRASKTEVVEDEWEDQSEAPSPRALTHRGSPLRLPSTVTHHESSSDHFETANEASDAFETAHERGTETEDFQTGVEDMSGDDDTATETEAGPSRGANSIKRPPPLPPHHSSHHYSFDSTASTSSEDDDYPSFSSEMKTPTSGPKMRMRGSRGSMIRRSRQFSEDTVPGSPVGVPDSKASVTPGGQSLFAELNDFDNSDSSSAGPDSPSRRSIRSATPATPHNVARGRLSPSHDLPALPKIMVDSGMMTEPVDIHPVPAIVGEDVEFGEGERFMSSRQGDLRRPMSMESVIAPRHLGTSTQWAGDQHRDGELSRPSSAISYSDASVQYNWDMHAKLAQLHSPPPTLSISSVEAQFIEPHWEPEPPSSPPPLSVSSILTEQTEPVTEVVELPALSMASLVSEHVEPVAEPELPLPTLSVPIILSQDIEPVVEPEPPLPEPPTLSVPVVLSQDIEPVSEPEIPLPEPPTLSVPTVLSQDIEPVSEPEIPLPEPPTLSVPTVLSQDIEPVAEPEVELPTFSVPGVLSQDIEPTPATPATLSLSTVHVEEVEPLAEPEPAPPTPITLSFSTVHAVEQVEPVAEPEVVPPSPIALSFSTLHVEQVEPVAELEPTPPTPVALSFSTIQTVEQVEPVAEPETVPPSPIALSRSAILFEQVEPVELPAPVVEERSVPKAIVPVPLPLPLPLPAPLSLSWMASEQGEPQNEVPATPVQLSVSSIATEEVEPLQEPETPAPSLAFASIQMLDAPPHEVPAPPLAVASIQSLDLPPHEAPAPPLALASIQSLDLPPHEVPAPPLALAPIQSLDAPPREIPAPPLAVASIQSLDLPPHETPASPLIMSGVQSWAVEPLDAPEVRPAPLSLSSIEAQNIEPIRPEQRGVSPILSFSGIRSLHTEPAEPRSPKRNAFIIPRDVESAGNSARDVTHGQESNQARVIVTADHGAQTALTSEALDQMLREKTLPSEMGVLERSYSLGSMGTPSTVRVHRPRQESFDGSLRPRDMVPDFNLDIETPQLRRPGSPASGMASIYEVPPLPANHKEVIEAARSGSSQGGQGTIGNMGPPLFPASALKPQNQSLRPRTPTGSRRPISPISVASGRATPTPRAAGRRPSLSHGTADIHDVRSQSRATLPSRKSSISSFTSELDTRFNAHTMGGFDPQGFGPNTDPRMIQAITQTMIGEYLWKYTRKAGRGEISENRHRRYFWVHPYTRTLYWSDRDPSAAGRAELRAKSVQIEAVRVVADDNPMPPGLHRKSLIIVSPGRSIKFTCTTGQRHETWFNALSYLLLRTTDEGQTDAEEIAGHITSADVDEFNPSNGRRTTNGSRAPPSLSSYNSQTVRQSPTLEIPTLTPSRSKVSQTRPSYGTLSRISGYLKEGKMSGTFGSMRSRSVQGRQSAQDIYENSDLQDSAEDVREMIERQDREADRLENVRACCDGTFAV